MAHSISMPTAVSITEVGPRDGLQMEKKVVPTQKKADLIAGLVAAGLQAIQVAALVHPRKVPQMADAEALIERLPLEDGVQYSALTLNAKGAERACGTAIPWIEVSLSASDHHSRQNAGLSIDQAQVEIGAMLKSAQQAGRKVRGSIQCAFGCVHEGPIPVERIIHLATRFLDKGVDILVLADTTGMATPVKIRRTLEAVLPLAGSLPLGLHLHDTRGLGLVNAVTALEMGISHFDTSLGGLGGCPFVPGAAGNIATEDTVHMMQSLGMTTGIDPAKVTRWSKRLSDYFGHDLPGKLYRLL